MPIQFRGEDVLKVSYRSKDAVNVSYATDDAHVFTNDGNSDALAPQTAGTFLFEDAMVTVTIDAAGNVSVSAVLATDNSVVVSASTTADFTASSPVNSATNRSVQVDLVVPTVDPAYDNQGQTVTGVLEVAQTVDPLDTCSIGDWVNDGPIYNFGSCSAASSFAGDPCGAATGTTNGTQQRRQNQVRTVTRVVNGLQDLTNPCSGVATTQTINAGSIPCSNPSATNSNYDPSQGVSTTSFIDDATVWNGDCVTTAGCCPDAMCDGVGSETGSFVRRFEIINNCDGSGTGTYQTTAQGTTMPTSRPCPDYPNPDTCSICAGLAAPTATGPTVCTVLGSTTPNDGCMYDISTTTGFVSTSGFVFPTTFDPCLANNGSSFTYYTAAGSGNANICDGSVPANGTAGSITLTFTC